MHIRAQIVPSTTSFSDGMPHSASVEGSAPLRLDPTDDVDALYAQLVDWVIYWAETLQVQPPAITIAAWSVRHEVQGFAAGTTPEGAHALTHIQTMALLIWTQRIIDQSAALIYFEDLISFLARATARYPMIPARPPTVLPRPCPVCHELAIVAEWYGEGIEEVNVFCQHCGHEIASKSLVKILKWLN